MSLTRIATRTAATAATVFAVVVGGIAVGAADPASAQPNTNGYVWNWDEFKSAFGSLCLDGMGGYTVEHGSDTMECHLPNGAVIICHSDKTCTANGKPWEEGDPEPQGPAGPVYLAPAPILARR